MHRYWLSIVLVASLVALRPPAPVCAQPRAVRADTASSRATASVEDPSRQVATEGLKPLSAGAMPNTQPAPGLMPPDVVQALFERKIAGPEESRPANWAPIDYHWYASNLRHRPLYFEDAMLERHGQTRHPLVQPFASGARFFLTFPALPYAMTVHPPRPALYTLGHFRPGSGAPILLQRPPLQIDAGVIEAAAWVGLIFLVP